MNIPGVESRWGKLVQVWKKENKKNIRSGLTINSETSIVT